jgi:hypothetical protein
LVYVLNSLPSPIDGALAELATHDIATLLTSTPLKKRGDALRAIGIPVEPRTVGQALCQDVLTKLERVHLHDVSHFALLVTGPVFLDMALRSRQEASDDDTDIRWSEAILRFTLWATKTVSLETARILAWAGTQPWFLPQTISEAHSEEVLAAAAVALALTPTDQAGADKSTTESEEAEDAESELEAEADESEFENHEIEVTDRGVGEGPVEAETAVVALDDLRTERADLDALLATAGMAAQRLLEAIGAGQMPVASDIDAITSLRSAFQHLADILTLEDTRVAAIDARLLELEYREQGASVRARLEKLRSLDGGSAPTAPFAALHELIDDTLARIDEADVQDTIAGLTAFTDLIDLVASVGVTNADQQRLMDLQVRCFAVLTPPLLVLLPGMVMSGQLRWASLRSEAVEEAEETLSGAHDESSEPLTAGLEREATCAPAQPPADDATESVEASEFKRAGAPQPTADSAQPLEVSAEVSGTPASVAEAPPSSVQAPTVLQPAPERRAESPAPVIGELIVGRRFGLAATLAEKARMAEARVAVLRLSALADAMRGETGPCASRLRAELPALDPYLLGEETATARLAVVALLRTALVTGDPTAGALLTSLSGRVERPLALISDQVARQALQGVLNGNPLRTVLADVGGLDTQMEEAKAAARDMLRPRSLRFKRATDIAKEWLKPNGILGTLLQAAARDERKRRAEVTSRVLELSGHGVISKEIDWLDAKFKGNSGKPIQGAVRQDLITLAEDALHRVSAWLESINALDSATQGGAAWATSELTEMRDVVLSHADSALASLETHIGRGDAFAGAAAVAARDSLHVTFELLRGKLSLPVREPSADLALTAELLKVPGATVEPASGLVTAPAGTGVDDLVAAAGRSWQDAFDAQLMAEQFPTAAYVLAGVRAGTLTTADGGLEERVEETLQIAEQRSRADLQAVREQLRAQLQRARLRNEVSEEQDGELTTMLEAADSGAVMDSDHSESEGRRSLSTVRAQLDAVATLLPKYREEAAQRLRDRLDQLMERATRQVPVDEPRIQRLIKNGELSTAEELIYYCEVGEPVPEDTVRQDLRRFFPEVPEALPNGITSAVVDAARAGMAVPGCAALDFSRLSEHTREAVADALKDWRLLAATPVEGRNQISERQQLLPALRLAGFEFDAQTKTNRLDNVRRGRERRFVELTNISWNGRAVVPQFGSKLNGRLRVLLCWGQPREDLLMSWVDQDTSTDAILVAYFGTMSAEVRRRLATRTPGTGAPVVVLDDAALAYLAVFGDRQLDAAMAILLPFSAVQPYVSQKRSLVAPEMFYGRDKERRAVIDPNGTQVIFGGRGLGKSALLRTAKDAFEREPGRIGIHIELNTADIGPNRQGADAVWDLLLRDLEGSVIPLSKAARRGKRNHEIVRAGIRGWLEEDSRRRLLILLDESDGFFEADATQFSETNRLKELGQMSGFEGRVKVVFAGLHSVQRFAKVSNNTFKHLAQRPTVIGPLPPQYAYNLIARPMEAIGYRFEDADLVNRILGYCSYQPYLLQMFGHRLVEHMHAHRTPAKGVAADEPPFFVTAEDVLAVESDPELKGDITSTFRDTLNLDPRYNVIANVLAHHAHEHGMDQRLTEVELRNECAEYWPEGFAQLDIEGFRAYLHEMTGLGALAPNHDQRGWHLRSPNVLRMIGSRDDVVAELVNASSETVPSEFIALETRRPLPDGTRAPLTAAQIDDLLGDHTNQVRLVLGSSATRVEQVGASMRAVCEDLAGRYTLIEARNRKQFSDALTGGKPGERRVVLSDLLVLGAKNEGCSDSLKAAVQERPAAPGVTRSVILVAGTEQMRFWQETFAVGEQPGLGMVALRRLDKRAMRVWSLDTEHFMVPERQARLLDITGGWPHLAERAVKLVEERGSEDKALAQLAQELGTRDGAASLVKAVGLGHDQELARIFDTILAYAGSGTTMSDLLEAIKIAGQPDPDSVLACIQALSVFDVSEDGTYRVERVLERSWPHRWPIADSED